MAPEAPDQTVPVTLVDQVVRLVRGVLVAPGGPVDLVDLEAPVDPVDLVEGLGDTQDPVGLALVEGLAVANPVVVEETGVARTDITADDAV